MKVRDKATGAISTVVSLVKHPFGQTPTPIRFDAHAEATTGPTVEKPICAWCNIEIYGEQAADNYQSAMADRKNDIIYLAERRRR